MAALVLLLVATSVLAAEQYPVESYKEIEKLFVDKGYTIDRWQKGIREIPRIYPTKIPKQWKDKYSKEISVADKNRLFF